MLLLVRPYRPQAGHPSRHCRHGHFNCNVRDGEDILDYDHHKMRRRCIGRYIFVSIATSVCFFLLIETGRAIKVMLAEVTDKSQQGTALSGFSVCILVVKLLRLLICAYCRLRIGWDKLLASPWVAYFRILKEIFLTSTLRFGMNIPLHFRALSQQDLRYSP